MKSIYFFIGVLITYFIFSCQPENSDVLPVGKFSNELNPRSSLNVTWDICKPCSESDASFRVTQSGSSNSLDFTPSCGTPSCVDDGSGTLCAQARVVITISGSTLDWNPSTCTLNLPSGIKYFIRQYSGGTCLTHGFNWSDSTCTSSPMGNIYIKSQVYPSCTPYVTNNTCIDVDPK